MSDRIQKGYTNFLEFYNRRNKNASAKNTAASPLKGFMTPPQGQKKQQQSNGQFAQLQRVADIVDEIKKSREV